MSLLDNLLKPGLTALGTLTGDAFTYEGQPGFFGTFDAERVEIVFEQIGQREVVRRTCLPRKSQWLQKPDPALRPLIVFEGSTYVLTGIGEDGVHYVFTLEKRT